MKNSFVAAAILILYASVLLTSCSKDDASVADPTAGLFKIAEGFASGSAIKVGIYARNQNLKTGYQPLFIQLTDSATGSPVNSAEIRLAPLMDMGMMQHGSPAEDPATLDAVSGMFPCAVVFTMPSTGGSWTLDVVIKNILTGRTGTFSTPLTVSEPAESRMKTFTSLHNGAKFYVTLLEPSAPKVGVNDMEIAVYKMESMMSFPADSSLSVFIEPEMPTMGHGSPNNIHPVHAGKGHYKGRVNFTMTGLWRVHADFLSGGSVADSTQYFDITF